ncbi:MAG: hypothetical protein J5789_06165 [Oscillospiraceae bacterium]|jgi:hypothetical protein|nr:hypothetical protein [Oscillospiraceae bacterium]
MTYEKMTGAINLEELEVQAEEVTEVSAACLSNTPGFKPLLGMGGICI